MTTNDNANTQRLILVFGATGQTGQHFVRTALENGDRVRTLARTTSKLSPHANLDIHQGSITEAPDLDRLVNGADAVVVMLGDKAAQRTRRINTEFVKELIPVMRKHHVSRLRCRVRQPTAGRSPRSGTTRTSGT